MILQCCIISFFYYFWIWIFSTHLFTSCEIFLLMCFNILTIWAVVCLVNLNSFFACSLLSRLFYKAASAVNILSLSQCIWTIVYMTVSGLRWVWARCRHWSWNSNYLLKVIQQVNQGPRIPTQGSLTPVLSTQPRSCQKLSLEASAQTWVGMPLPLVGPNPSLSTGLSKWGEVLGPSPCTVPTPVPLVLGAQARSNLPVILSWQKPNLERYQSPAPSGPSPALLSQDLAPMSYMLLSFWCYEQQILTLTAPTTPRSASQVWGLEWERGPVSHPRSSSSCNGPEWGAQPSGTCPSFPGEGQHNQLQQKTQSFQWLPRVRLGVRGKWAGELAGVSSWWYLAGTMV